LVQDAGPLSKKAISEGIKVIFLKMRGWRKIKYVSINYLITLPKLVKLAKSLNIDIVHCNAYRLNPYAVRLARSLNISCITHIRWFKNKKHIKKFDLDKADFLITVSKHLAALFLRSSCNFTTIYDGINIDKFAENGEAENKIRKEFNIKYDDFLVGMIAQITLRKGHKDFIKAASLVERKIKNVKFLIVGGAILDKSLTIEDLKYYANKISANNLIFAGQRSDIKNIYNALDCFVLPSHEEPLGLVVIEAMAAKVPVIATKSGGPSEIISDQEDGLLVPIRSPDEIAKKIIELKNDPQFSKKIIKAAFKTAKEKFNIKNYVKNVELIYEKCI
jgi:glycosyltransferase involved in cell wall biosynthesis